MSSPNVSFIRPELAKLLPLYQLIRDCISGEVTVKGQREKYLPKPNAQDTSPENKLRYEAYLTRAVYYNVTRRTLAGLIGQVFMKDPLTVVPTILQPVVEDSTGSGISIVQESKKALNLTLAYSRCGVLVDYPETEGGATVEQLANGDIRPTITTFPPHQITNWRTEKRGAKEILSLVVIAEAYEYEDDGFELKRACQFRALRLSPEGNYIQEIYKEKIARPWNGEEVPKRFMADTSQLKTIFVMGPDGNPVQEIPFTFIGSENNDPNPDNPNMYDIASLNIAHYRNSADYEESCYIVGQPTPVMTGLTEEWVKNVLKGTINFGSRGGIPLPVGATADLLQANEGTMLKEALEAKERQMVALGAKLVEQKDVQRTATEAKIESTGEGSILSSCTKNVTAAFLFALEWCAFFMNIKGQKIEFELNTDFDLANMTPEQAQSYITAWVQKAITFTEMRDGLRRADIATEDDAKALVEITAVAKADLEMQQAVANVGKSPVNSQS